MVLLTHATACTDSGSVWVVTRLSKLIQLASEEHHIMIPSKQPSMVMEAPMYVLSVSVRLWCIRSRSVVILRSGSSHASEMCIHTYVHTTSAYQLAVVSVCIVKWRLGQSKLCYALRMYGRSVFSSYIVYKHYWLDRSFSTLHWVQCSLSYTPSLTLPGHASDACVGNGRCHSRITPACTGACTTIQIKRCKLDGRFRPP